MKTSTTTRPRIVRGTCLAFRYPTSPRVIRLEVLTVRDLRQKPLQAITLALYPDRPRGQTLLTGLDLDTLKLRKVYLEVMTELEVIPPPAVVLASYDPLQPDEAPKPVPAAAIGKRPTFTDLVVLMRRGNARAAHDPAVHRLLGIFPAGLFR